jgi:hypothetical protein
MTVRRTIGVTRKPTRSKWSLHEVKSTINAIQWTNQRENPLKARRDTNIGSSMMKTTNFGILSENYRQANNRYETKINVFTMKPTGYNDDYVSYLMKVSEEKSGKQETRYECRKFDYEDRNKIVSLELHLLWKFEKRNKIAQTRKRTVNSVVGNTTLKHEYEVLNRKMKLSI